MTRRELIVLLQGLVELLEQDLAEVEPAAVAAGVRDAEAGAASCLRWSGLLLAELRRRGVTWSQLARSTGVPQTTVVRRVDQVARTSVLSGRSARTRPLGIGCPATRPPRGT
jgi:hypothetical protein